MTVNWLLFTSVTFVFRICSFLPLLGLLTAFLPEIEQRRKM